jgi:hypothetical protein
MCGNEEPQFSQMLDKVLMLLIDGVERINFRTHEHREHLYLLHHLVFYLNMLCVQAVQQQRKVQTEQE